jgi:hypothetical protein
VLIGRFGNTSGCPYIEGRLLIPRFSIHGDFSSIVDTGADNTFLMPADAATMGLDYGRLENFDDTAKGAGGPINSYKEPAWAVFSDGTELFGYAFTLTILEYRGDMLNVPSLLGRDILHRWTMDYQFSGSRLQFEIESADVVIPGISSLGVPNTVHQ